VSAGELAERLHLPEQTLRPYLDRLVEQGDLAARDSRFVLSAAGRDAAERLVDSRSAQLADLLGDVPADERADLMQVLHDLAASLLIAPAGKTLLEPAR
jgi:DNA-binding MarR family transcriptional regulator